MLPRLVAISAGNQSKHAAPGARKDFLTAVSAAVESGLPALVLREPLLSDRDYTALAQEIRALMDGRFFILHDRPHLVSAVDADGVHLSFRGLPAPVVRDMLPSGCMLGTSAHQGDDASLHSVSDYCFAGPVWDTPSKRGLLEPLGVDGFAALVRRLACPTYALGGVLPAHVPALLQAGAYGVATLGGWHPCGTGTAHDTRQTTGQAVQAYLTALETST